MQNSQKLALLISFKHGEPYSLFSLYFEPRKLQGILIHNRTATIKMATRSPYISPQNLSMAWL